MAEFVKLNPGELQFLHEQNPDLVSYNVEFAEVTGGTFWKAYTPEQIAGTEPFYVEPSADGIAAMYKDLMQVYPPANVPLSLRPKIIFSVAEKTSTSLKCY